MVGNAGVVDLYVALLHYKILTNRPTSQFTFSQAEANIVNITAMSRRNFRKIAAMSRQNLKIY
jgi:hypothetical protein